MKLKNKIISGLLTATTLVSLCAFSAGAVSTDKKFSVEDATLIQKNVVGMTTFDEKQIKLYDLNKDGVITVVDSTLVQKIIVGLIKEPTEEQPTTAESTTEPTDVCKSCVQSCPMYTFRNFLVRIKRFFCRSSNFLFLGLIGIQQFR